MHTECRKAAFWRVYGVRSECELLDEGMCMVGGNPHICSGGPMCISVEFSVSMDVCGMQKAAFWRVYGVRSECELLNEGVCMFGGNPHLCSAGLL